MRLPHAIFLELSKRKIDLQMVPAIPQLNLRTLIFSLENNHCNQQMQNTTNTSTMCGFNAVLGLAKAVNLVLEEN